MVVGCEKILSLWLLVCHGLSNLQFCSEKKHYLLYRDRRDSQSHESLVRVSSLSLESQSRSQSHVRDFLSLSLSLSLGLV